MLPVLSIASYSNLSGKLSVDLIEIDLFKILEIILEYPFFDKLPSTYFLNVLIWFLLTLSATLESVTKKISRQVYFSKGFVDVNR